MNSTHTAPQLWLRLNLIVLITGFFVAFHCLAEPSSEEQSTAIAPTFKQLQPEKSFIQGHNLTSTSDILNKGHCQVGVILVGCGLTDNLMIGTSPWLYRDYNMNSVGVRTLLSESASEKWALQFDYFKTYKNRTFDLNTPTRNYEIYQMEAMWLVLINTQIETNYFKYHLNMDINYYFDEKMPFSLRRPFMTTTPWQLNASVLSEFSLTKHLYILNELGLLDYLRAPLHMHVGASLGYRYKGFDAHMGFTMTGTSNSFFNPYYRGDYQQQLRTESINGYSSELETLRVEYDFSIHPEFSLSYLF